MGRVRTGPIEGSRRDGAGKSSAAREDRADEASKPEDRPSKLSHALSVLRKPRIGGWWCVSPPGSGGPAGGEGGRRGAEDDDRSVRKR